MTQTWRATGGRGRGNAVVLVACTLGACMVLAVSAAAGDAASEKRPDDAESLARREADLAREYVELERSFLRLADLLATSDPRRAAVLRDAFDRARREEVGERLDGIVRLLEEGQLLKAGTSQQDSIERMRALLGLLEEGGGDRGLSDTKQEVRRYLARLGKLIARQRDIEGSTEAGGDEDALADRQREAAEEAAALAGEIGDFADRIDEKPATAGEGGAKAGAEQRPDDAPGGERPPGNQEDQPAGEPNGQQGEPPPEAGGDPPAGQPDEAGQEPAPIEGDDESSRARRTRQRLQAAERRMREARERLEEARRRDARAEQEKAIEELETARAELEEILRQLREEEVERLLVQLEARIRGMLKAEREVLSGAEALAGAEGLADRERQLEAARLGREQAAITTEVARALTLVRDDGSAVAIPEALGQVQDDSTQAATRLGRGDVGAATLGIVTDIVAGLEELLAALEKSRREEEARQQAGAGGGRPAEPGEQPLVDRIAELKMLRSLQLRVNGRTGRFARLLAEGAERAEEPELVEALRRLADRQRAIERAARDIVAGRTEE